MLPKALLRYFFHNFFLYGILIIEISANFEFHPNWPTETQNICGQSIQNRIIGGTNAQLGEHPWIARFGITVEPFPPIYHCGGSIITKWYILTAAHCYQQAEPFTKNGSRVIVRLGEFNTTSNPDCENGICADPYQEITIKSYILHENFNRKFFYENDIALVKLSREINFTKWIKPICLPTTFDLHLVGTTIQVIGFGYINNNNEKATILQKIDLTVLDSKDAPNWKLTDKQVVAGELNRGSCIGDSGGPAIQVTSTPQGPRLTQVALVSYGTEKCGTQIPAVYTNIVKYTQWILDHMFND